jgi:hypothetical protein
MIKAAPTTKLMLIAAVSRVFIFTTALTTNAIFGVRQCKDCWNIDLPFINLFSRWDSGYYADIALKGYDNLITAKWEFFPGYPIIIGTLGRLFALVTHAQLLLAIHFAGFIVSNLAFFVSVHYFYKLSMTVLSNASMAYESTILFAFYPAGVFFSAVYSDSFFLMLTIGSLYYWRVEKLGKSAVFGFLAALTRPVGILLILPFLYELLVKSSLRKKAVSYLPPATIVLGYFGFMVYSLLMTGTPFANFEAEHMLWGVTLNVNGRLLSDFKELLTNHIIIPYLIMSIVAMITSISIMRGSSKTAFNLYATCLLATYFFAPLDSFPRYSITLIPLYWVLSKWSENRYTKNLIYVMFFVLSIIGTGLFVNWYSFY